MKPQPRVFAAVTADDRRRAYALRYSVYVDEMGKVLAGADHERRELRDPHDEHAEILCLEVEGEVVGTVRNVYADEFLPAEYVSWFSLPLFDGVPLREMSFTSRLMLAREHRGTSTIGSLLKANYIRGRERQVRYTFIHCAPALIPMYEMLGFRIYKRGLIDTGISQQVPMLLVADDAAHLEATGSPFARLAGGFPTRAPGDSWFERRFPEYRVPSSCKTGGAESFLSRLSASLTDERGAIFDGIEADGRNELLRGGSIVEAGNGDHVLRMGETGNELFVVIDGLVEIVRPGARGGRLVLRNVGAGQAFGEMAFLSPTARSANAVSVGASRLLCLSRESMLRTMRTAPGAAARFLLNLSQILAERLATTTTRLQEEGVHE